MEKCLKLADYKNASKRRIDSETRGKLYGIGVSSSVDPSGSPAPEAAELRFDPGGTVTVMTASTAGGQSHATIYTQIVSETLGIDAEKIRVVEGDTSQHSFGSGTGAARTATICGSVVLLAAEKTREKAKKIAAHMLEAADADIEFDDGNFDKRDVNTHQAKSYLLRLQRQKETITPGTSQPEVFNVLGQLEALEKGLRENTLSLDAKKTKKLK